MKCTLQVGMCVLILSGCAETPSPPSSPPTSPATPEARKTDSAWWTPVAAPEMQAHCGSELPEAIPEVNGAGVSLIDVDGDGVLEILLAQGATLGAPESGPGCRLFRRQGEGWADATAASGIEVHGWATSATPFDLEGDGDSDLVITRIGNDVLLRNDGGRFTDITHEAGFNSPGWGTCAAVGDVNGDGFCDVYIVNYLDWNFDAPLPKDVPFMGQQVLAGPRGMAPQGDRLFLNAGDGRLTDVSERAGINDIAPGFGLNALITDLDGDGVQDILVGNDTTPNMLLRVVSDEPLKLEDAALGCGLATNADGSAQATMGLAVGDVNADGMPDVFSTNFSSDTNTLHVSSAGGWFADRTQAWGLGLPSRPFLGWTTFFLDGDLDGDEDLLILNGHVYPQATMQTMDSEWAQPVLLLERDGNRFARRTSDLDHWAASPSVHRAGALGVLDDRASVPSLVTAPRDRPMEVLRASASGPLQRCTLQLVDDRPGIGNREGHGAHVVIDDGTRVHHRWVTTSSPFQGASAAQLHATVGQGAPRLQVRVNWPDGPSTTHEVPCGPGVVRVRRSEGTITEP
ncbi:MAG: CRTAC1 family protein [Phycisphaerales bacterium]|nr:CRTAC1 family protein [Phycisphaerales bacterium]